MNAVYGRLPALTPVLVPAYHPHWVRDSCTSEA